MNAAPAFPPLLSGAQVVGEDPFSAACRAAREGCDAGLILYDPGAERLSAAIVFAPEVPLKRAAAMLPLCGVALQNALGAIGPSEVAVHLGWDGAILVNGATCGAFRMAAATPDPGTVPDWLVVGFTLELRNDGGDTGRNPDRTALSEEGCGHLTAGEILESWSRHALTWIHRWEDEGMAPLHREWTGLAHGLGDPVGLGTAQGTFLGVDEDLGMLLKAEGTTTLIPLTELLEDVQ